VAALHTAIAIVLVVGLIIRLRVEPVIALVVGSLYLGLASGVGFAGTAEAITTGFGDIMAEVGLLIGFGVLIGSLLHASGAFRRLVDVLVRTVGPGRLPYAMAVLLSAVMPSIYVDVQVVLASPVARSSAPHIGRHGLPWMASSLGVGILVGYVFVVPGLAAISIAGLLDLQLGTWLLYGLVLGPVTAVLTTLVMRQVLRTGYWKPATDEEVDDAMVEAEAQEQAALTEHVDEGARQLPLLVLFLPILVPLLLIAFAAFADVGGFSTSWIAFLGNANVALFLGLLGAYAASRRTEGEGRTEKALRVGFHTTGEILLITGVGGSLGAVITETGLDQVLAGMFSAEAGAPVVLSVLLVWFVAALLHLAIGSISVAAITASGIIAPILDSISVAPIAIGLAIASGSVFALQVNSNFFWMFKQLLGLSTTGTLKTLTVVTSLGSLISLPAVVLIALVVPA